MEIEQVIFQPSGWVPNNPGFPSLFIELHYQTAGHRILKRLSQETIGQESGAMVSSTTNTTT